MKKLFWRMRWAAKTFVIRCGLGDRLIEFCQRCGRRQPLVWRAPDALWLEINEGKQGGVFCPECFDDLAQARGISLRWQARFDYIFERNPPLLSAEYLSELAERLRAE